MIAPTNTPSNLEKAVRQAAALLRAGEVVALPTETVYGLAANGLEARAVEKIFEAKGRPAYNPVIVHVSSMEMTDACAGRWTEAAAKLAGAFWPGPLTLVVSKAARIPDIVTAGGSTVGLRWPKHPVIQAVLEACGFPLAAPSANRSGQVSPTTAEHVRRVLGERIALILDGGPTEIGIESTVVDVSVSPPRLLRPGMIAASAVAEVIGSELAAGDGEGSLLRSPGLLLKHYAPKAALAIWHGSDADLRKLSGFAGRVHLLTRRETPVDVRLASVSVMPDEPRAFAKALYAELHRADEAGAELIVIEAVPNTPEWQALADRLQRAAA